MLIISTSSIQDFIHQTGQKGHFWQNEKVPF